MTDSPSARIAFVAAVCAGLILTGASVLGLYAADPEYQPSSGAVSAP